MGCRQELHASTSQILAFTFHFAQCPNRQATTGKCSTEFLTNITEKSCILRDYKMYINM